jgi:hypothetical protein
MTVRPGQLNLDSRGFRVPDPVCYGLFVKTSRPYGYRKIEWTTEPAPLHILQAVEAQLEQALAYVRSRMAQAANEPPR